MCGSEILPAGGNTFLEFTQMVKRTTFFSLLLLHLPLLLCGLSKQGSVLCLQYAVLAVDFHDCGVLRKEASQGIFVLGGQ